MAFPAKCATISVTNIAVPANSSTLIFQPCSVGFAQLRGGFVGIGSFSIGDAAIRGAQTARDVLDHFALFGQAVAMGFGANTGLYRHTVTSAITEGDPWSGKSVYSVIGAGGLTFADSTMLLVFKHPHVFQNDPLETAPALVMLGKGEVILPSSLECGVHVNIGNTFITVLRPQVFPIPEPACLAPMGLALVFLLPRRARMVAL